MTAQLQHVRQTRLTRPDAVSPKTPGRITTRKSKFHITWPSFLRRKVQHRDSVDTRFRSADEGVSPRSPGALLQRMSMYSSRSLGTAARTPSSIGSPSPFASFRRAMSRRSESRRSAEATGEVSPGRPLGGGDT